MLKPIFLLAIIYTAIITIFSFKNLNSLPSFDMLHKDKLGHFLAYGLLVLLWYNALFRSRKIKTIILVAAGAILYGIIIEVLQGVMTVNRDADFIDGIANTLGVITMAVILIVKQKRSVKKT